MIDGLRKKLESSTLFIIIDLKLYYRAIVIKKTTTHGISTETDRLINGIEWTQI